ncbi:MAG: glycerol-3-phosphate 1-O-acyltransferase PlsY [Acidobacteriaceae bacterium]
MISTYIVVAIIAYLLGSIPFGYILVRVFTGADVRAQGSGNIGATNVARTGKKGLAIATLILDALKGALAISLSQLFVPHFFDALGSAVSRPPNSPAPETGNIEFGLMAVAALFAILGHMYPVWLKFKGGKGVATGLGVFLALAPKAVLIVLVFFLIIVAITRYVSLGSIVAAALFPIAFYYLHPQHGTTLILTMISGVSLLIIWKHRENIRRLIAGNENKFGARKA